MVALVRKGRSMRSVARRFGVTLRTVQRWVERAGSRRLDRVDFSGARGGRRESWATDEQLEQQVIEVRQDLRQHSDLGEFGAAAIRRELLRRQSLAGIGPADVHCRDPRVIPLITVGARPVGDGVLAVATNANVVFCQLGPWQFGYAHNYGPKRTFRRTAFLVNRLLANLGVRGQTPLLERWASASRRTGSLA